MGEIRSEICFRSKSAEVLTLPRASQPFKINCGTRGSCRCLSPRQLCGAGNGDGKALALDSPPWHSAPIRAQGSREGLRNWRSACKGETRRSRRKKRWKILQANMSPRPDHHPPSRQNHEHIPSTIPFPLPPPPTTTQPGLEAVNPRPHDKITRLELNRRVGKAAHHIIFEDGYWGRGVWQGRQQRCP